MLEVADALAAVLRAARPLPSEPIALTSAALGRVLAEDIHADIDSPPFTKAMMDGFAVRSVDLTSAHPEVRYVHEVPAGAANAGIVGPGQAARIFTGAPIPDGADAVVKQEDVTIQADGTVWLRTGTVKPGQNVLPRGTEMRAGDVVLPTGTVLTPATFGLLAGVGRAVVRAGASPKVGILATGNELVEATVTPGPGQIRNTNGPMLAAQVARAGAVPRVLGVGRDDTAALTEQVRAGLETSDVLVLAGGVSVGKFDLVPDVLRQLGVEAHFHKVRMKPGKPLLFGTRGDKLIFGLPGNPVSSFVCFELFVRPALKQLAGHTTSGPTRMSLPLAAPLHTSNDRPTYHPGRLDGPRVRPLPWFGSADLRALLAADALLALPAGDVTLTTGDVAEVIVL